MAKTGEIAAAHHHRVEREIHPVETKSSDGGIAAKAVNADFDSPTAYLERIVFDPGKYRQTALSFKHERTRQGGGATAAKGDPARGSAPRQVSKPPVSKRFEANPGTYGSRGGTDIDAIVLHHTAGSTASGAANALNSRGLSAHYVVDKDGTIYQMIGDEKRAFHAGRGSGKWTNANSRSIGIEIVNLGNGSDRYTEAQYKALEKLVPYLAQKYKIPVGNIVGHSQIGNPGRPATNPEPSRNFNFTRIRQSVGNGGGTPAPNPNPPNPNPPTKPKITAPTAFLERGERGAEVKKLQNAFVKLKYMTRAQVNTGPGIFGPRTENALKEFQRDHKDLLGRRLVADGIYGRLTRGALRKALHRAQPNPQPNPNPSPGSGSVNINNIEDVKNNRHVTPAFLREVKAMAKRLDTKPEYLLAVMSFESGISPTAVNGRSNATGLIQFLPSTAQGLGTTVAALKQMSSLEQLKYVEKYLSPFKGRLGTLEGIYTSVLSGSPRPNPGDVLFSRGTKAYAQNSGLDFNKNGKITSGEATSAVAAKMFGGVKTVQRKLEQLGFDPRGVDGIFGLNTSKAVAAFQRSRKLSATGLLNERTGSALLKAKPSESNNGGSKPSGRPSVGRITSDFGPRVPPFPGASSYHRGTDFGAPYGSRVQSTAPGKVVSTGNEAGGAGNYVVIDHGNGYQTKYFHLSEINVREGQRVGDSQKIGEVGSTGSSSGPHLHYEVLRNGQHLDPEKFF